MRHLGNLLNWAKKQIPYLAFRKQHDKYFGVMVCNSYYRMNIKQNIFTLSGWDEAISKQL